MTNIEQIAENVMTQLISKHDVDESKAIEIKLKVIKYFNTNSDQYTEKELSDAKIVTGYLGGQDFLLYAIKCHEEHSLLLYSKENAAFDEKEQRCSYGSWIVTFERGENEIYVLICE